MKILHLGNILVASQMFGRYYGYLANKKLFNEWSMQASQQQEMKHFNIKIFKESEIQLWGDSSYLVNVTVS